MGTKTCNQIFMLHLWRNLFKMKMFLYEEDSITEFHSVFVWSVSYLFCPLYVLSEVSSLSLKVHLTPGPAEWSECSLAGQVPQLCRICCFYQARCCFFMHFISRNEWLALDMSFWNAPHHEDKKSLCVLQVKSSAAWQLGAQRISIVLCFRTSHNLGYKKVFHPLTMLRQRS